MYALARKSPVADVYYEGWMAQYWVSLGSDGGFFFGTHASALRWANESAVIVRDHSR